MKEDTLEFDVYGTTEEEITEKAVKIINAFTKSDWTFEIAYTPHRRVVFTDEIVDWIGHVKVTLS